MFARRRKLLEKKNRFDDAPGVKLNDDAMFAGVEKKNKFDDAHNVTRNDETTFASAEKKSKFDDTFGVMFARRRKLLEKKNKFDDTSGAVVINQSTFAGIEKKIKYDSGTVILNNDNTIGSMEKKIKFGGSSGVVLNNDATVVSAAFVKQNPSMQSSITKEQKRIVSIMSTFAAPGGAVYILSNIHGNKQQKEFDSNTLRVLEDLYGLQKEQREIEQKFADAGLSIAGQNCHQQGQVSSRNPFTTTATNITIDRNDCHYGPFCRNKFLKQKQRFEKRKLQYDIYQSLRDQHARLIQKQRESISSLELSHTIVPLATIMQRKIQEIRQQETIMLSSNKQSMSAEGTDEEGLPNLVSLNSALGSFD